MRFGWLFLFLSLVGCVGEEPIDVGAATETIINGNRETGRRWVVAVARTGRTGAAGLCTGSLIGDYAVLTAKHCVYDDSTGRWIAVPPGELLVVVGDDLGSPGGVELTSRVVEYRTTPGANVDRDIMRGNDVAVLLLPAPLGIGVLRTAVSPPSGRPDVTIVGFGRTMPGTPVMGDSGVKYRGTARIRQVGSRLIETTGASWTCQGDSGGPLVTPDNRISGVTSFGISGCNVSNSYYSRVDNHRIMIRQARDWRPPCTPSAEICDGIDNDCDGVVDPGCTQLGDPCATDDECAMGACEDVGGTRVCTRDCDARDAIPRCPFGFFCEATGCGIGRCIAGGPGGRSAGEECSAATECAALHCADVGGGVMRCGRQCTVDGEPCPADQACEAPGGGCGSCLPLELTTGPRSFGVPCEMDAECASTICSPEGFCTRTCGAADPCPGGFHCRSGLCVSGDLGGPGAECVNEEDCSTMAPDCVDADGDMLCVGPCDEMGICQLGFECVPTERGDRCLPPGLSFGESCTMNPECRSGVCAGICTRLCDDGNPCPEGYQCSAAGAYMGCFPIPEPPPPPPDDGGCSATPERSTGLGVLGGLALILMVLVARRRRAR